jgi:energy-coupling factor transport system ATP-binding protein
MIEIRDLAYRDLLIPDLTLHPGTTAIIGPNGSGKTTFLRLVAGLAQPDSGTISLDGREPGGWPTGYVNEYPDRNALFPTVYDELAGPLRFRRCPCRDIPKIVRRAAADNGLAGILDRPLETLSGGEKAMVAVQAAVLGNPRILILDEFDSHQDRETLDAAGKILSGSGAIYLVRCTQNMDLASRCDMVVALFQGSVRSAGTALEVFSSLSGTCYYPFSWRLFGAPCP